MSFYSCKAADNACCPGEVSGSCSCGVKEKICVSVKKVYDACMSQEQLGAIRVSLCDIKPTTERPVPPYTFVSCRSSSPTGTLRDVSIRRIAGRENFARVRATVDIPIDVVFTDSNNKEFTGKGTISLRKDVVLYVPCDSIIPYSLDNVVSAICVTGEYLGDHTFLISVCVTVILKVVAIVDLVMPAYGFCQTPACESFAENVCDDFFGLPIYPPQLEDCE